MARQSRLLLACLIVCFCSWGRSAQDEPVVYTYELVTEYPHDREAFTQGLVFDRECNNTTQQCYDILWESTGLYGKSSVRKVELASGRVLLAKALHRSLFGEGLARAGGRLYQITWRSGRGFVYEEEHEPAADSGRAAGAGAGLGRGGGGGRLRQVAAFDTGLPDGWGLTAVEGGKLLVASDSSPTLTWLHPGNFSVARRVTVTDGGRPLPWVNELEEVDGELWGNVWQTDCIARIDPATGRVVGWVLMHGLLQGLAAKGAVSTRGVDVLNGIAWDSDGRRLFVTGKLWPRLFEVKVVRGGRAGGGSGGPQSKALLQQARRSCWPSTAGFE